MRTIACTIASAAVILLSGSVIPDQARAMGGATEAGTLLVPTDISSVHRGHHRFHRAHARGPHFIPRGWHHGRKIGWHGGSRPPGLR
jgi:hypothetical protein